MKCNTTTYAKMTVDQLRAVRDRFTSANVAPLFDGHIAYINILINSRIGKK